MNWSSVRESSRVIRIIQAMWSGSVVVHAVDRVIAIVSRIVPDIADGPIDSAVDQDDDRMRAALDDSAIFRSVMSIGARLESAYRHSRVALCVTATRRGAENLALVLRIRLGALTLFTAVLVHVSLTRGTAPEPEPIARAIWAAILAVLAIAAAGADALALAWRERSIGRSRNESGIE